MGRSRLEVEKMCRRVRKVVRFSGIDLLRVIDFKPQILASLILELFPLKYEKCKVLRAQCNSFSPILADPCSFLVSEA